MLRPAHPIPALNAPISPLRHLATARRPLADLKTIKTGFGTTVNDVVLAACTMTLQRYLTAHDDLPPEPLVCSVPVSVHGKSESEGTNQVSTMFVRLPVQLGDPAEILRTINAETKEAKIMQSAIGADTLQDFAQFIPPTVFPFGPLLEGGRVEPHRALEHGPRRLRCDRLPGARARRLGHRRGLRGCRPGAAQAGRRRGARAPKPA
jgi:hypothetical protein